MNQNTSTDNLPPEWNLALVFYSSLEDPQIGIDLAKFEELAKAFHITYKGTIANRLGPAIAEDSAIEELGSKILHFGFLTGMTNLGNQEIQNWANTLQRKVISIDATHLSFFQQELRQLTVATIEKSALTDEVVLRHRLWLLSEASLKDHQLDANVETALMKRKEYMGVRPWSTFQQQLQKDFRFEYSGNQLSIEEAQIMLKTSTMPEERRRVAQMLSAALMKSTFADYTAKTYDQMTALHWLETKDRKYATPMSRTNQLNKISDELVATILQAIELASPALTKEYYGLKQRILGLPKLYLSDRNAPMDFPILKEVTVPYEKAWEIAVTATSNFSKFLGDKITKQATEQKIHARRSQTKLGGNFTVSTIIPNKVPVSYVVVHYSGALMDTFTLTHENWHALHNSCSGTNGYHLSKPSNILGEAMAAFGEELSFEEMKKELLRTNNKQALLGLYMTRIDREMNFPIRQAFLSRYEQRLHGANADYSTWETPLSHSAEQQKELYLELFQQFYGAEGTTFSFDGTGDYEWALITYFHQHAMDSYNLPFRPYSYAVSSLLVYGLIAKMKEVGVPAFEPLLIELMTNGSLMSLEDAMKPFGINTKDADFWAKSIEQGLGSMIQEAKQLALELGY